VEWKIHVNITARARKVLLMKKNTSNFKEKKADRPSTRLPVKNLNRIDQPFDHEAVAAVAGPEYVRHMNRDGLALVPYEEVRKNIPGFYLPEDKCVWMRAGVINFRLCDYDYDCYNCPFDQAMISAMDEKIAPDQEERQSYWSRHIKERYRITARPCIHFLSGRIESPEKCSANYHCDHCPVHELMDKETLIGTSEKSANRNVSGFNVVEDYYYHFGHSWVHIEDDGYIKVGIDDFSSKVLGTADAINLPPKGGVLRRGEIGCVLNFNDKKAPIQSPVSGTVYAVNDKVLKQPAVAHDDPYHDGWLFILVPANIKSDLEGLYSGKECSQWMEKESQNLHELLGPGYKNLAATGGEPIDDIIGHFPEISWDRLVRTLFRAAEKR
jgi:glycine cleavage system H lipoate-binding protein